MSLDQRSHQAFERLVRERPNRMTTSATNGGTPRPVVVPDATERKAKLEQLNAFIRQGATRTPFVVADAGDGSEAA